jgi:hypothetical protein
MPRVVAVTEGLLVPDGVLLLKSDTQATRRRLGSLERFPIRLEGINKLLGPGRAGVQGVPFGD